MAEAVVSRHDTGTAAYVALDAALCFGPLLLVGWLLANAASLRSAWIHGRSAVGLDYAVAGIWSLGGVLIGGVVA